MTSRSQVFRLYRTYKGKDWQKDSENNSNGRYAKVRTRLIRDFRKNTVLNIMNNMMYWMDKGTGFGTNVIFSGHCTSLISYIKIYHKIYVKVIKFHYVELAYFMVRYSQNSS